MRVIEHILLRNVMLYHFDKGISAHQSFCDLNQVYGEGTISYAQCKRWFARFKDGDRCLEDKE